MAKQPGTNASRQHGFTLVELLIVVVVIGILAAISGANYTRLRKNAKMAACISHQRYIMEAACVYTLDVDPPDGAMNCDVLRAGGYLLQEICECPSSPVDDYDDYTITWLNDLPIEVDCTVKGGEHDWQP